jgi:hypothetical protein
MRIGLRHFFAATCTVLNAYSVPVRGIGWRPMFSLMHEAQTGTRGNVSVPQSAQRPPIRVARTWPSTSSASPHRKRRVRGACSGASAMARIACVYPVLCTTERARA